MHPILFLLRRLCKHLVNCVFACKTPTQSSQSPSLSNQLQPFNFREWKTVVQSEQSLTSRLTHFNVPDKHRSRTFDDFSLRVRLARFDEFTAFRVNLKAVRLVSTRSQFTHLYVLQRNYSFRLFVLHTLKTVISPFRDHELFHINFSLNA